MPTADVRPEHLPSTIAVSMDDDVIMIRRHGEFDRETTETLLEVIDAATSCGTPVLIDLDGSGPSPAMTISPCTASHAVASDTTWGEPTVLAPGCVRVASSSTYWTFDLGRGRLFRSDEPIDHRFVEPSAWIGIRKVSVTESTTSVLTDDGTVMTTPAAWSRGALDATAA
jgi:hypothetical protein